MSDFNLSSFRGGLNDTDPAVSIPSDQCVRALNVEFFKSLLGERRRGCVAISLAGSTLASYTHLSALYRHLPSADETAAELWAMAVTPNGGYVVSRKTTAWADQTPNDAVTVTGVLGFQFRMLSLHGKLFLAYKSAVDRLHVHDGTSWRRVGLATPSAAPTAVDTGGGAFVGTRYYRFRYTVQSGGVTILRSEPSAVLTKAPSGAGTGLIVTKGATISESETHWELEASINNADFYRIATTVVGTTTVTDSVAYGVGYAASGTLSATSGDYTVPMSCKYLTTDDDRLIMLGSHDTPALSSRVTWAVVNGDTTGVGNDERVPIATNNFLDLDGREGGEITGGSASLQGYIFAFKYNHIYKLVRTGQRTQAYSAVCLTKKRGALDGSVVEGVDETGAACLYFLDPHVGPCRIGQNGLQICSYDVQTTWSTFNVNAATVASRAVYYPDTRQVIWWIATGSSDTPTLVLRLQTNLMRTLQDGARRGFSTADGTFATALSACMFATNIDSGIARSLTLAPFIGVSLSGAAAILRCDTGINDNGTVYRASVKSKPFTPASILNRFAAAAGALLAVAAAGVTVSVRFIRDFGLDTPKQVDTIGLAPVGTETDVIVTIDNLAMADGMRALQVEFGDLDLAATPAGRWELNGFATNEDPQEVA